MTIDQYNTANDLRKKIETLKYLEGEYYETANMFGLKTPVIQVKEGKSVLFEMLGEKYSKEVFAHNKKILSIRIKELEEEFKNI